MIELPRPRATLQRSVAVAHSAITAVVATLSLSLLQSLSLSTARADETRPVPDLIAHSGHTDAVPEVVVVGHYNNAVGTSDAASAGSITSQLLKTRPASRPGEVLEFIPGMIVTQHSGEGKANQYFLRGFNLDHGTDFSTFIAGMPINLPTHAHGHGYTDLSFLIPELIDRIDYQKGPYYADSGDFSTAGSARISLKNSLAQPLFQIDVGAQRFRRALLAGSRKLDDGQTLLAALELQGNDGPWDNPMNLRKINGVLRLSHDIGANRFDITAMHYQSRWNASDQIPQRAVDAGLISRFGSIDPSGGGDTRRSSLSSQWRQRRDDGAIEGNLYAIRYALNLFSNFTYFDSNPVNGDQFEQADSRHVYGGSLKRIWLGRLGNREMSNEIGLQLRHDRIRVGLFDTEQRQRLADTRDDRVRQTSVGLMAQNTVTWTPWLRSVSGLRWDHFRFDVRNQLQGAAQSQLAQNDGVKTEALVSPKLSLIWGPWSKTELFTNWGRGFHSNDARGVLTRVDPKSGDPVQPVPGLVRTTGYELGVRTEAIANLQSSLALWRLKLGSELLFVGDAGTTEPSRPSIRQGVEWSNRYTPYPWLLFDLDLAVSQARYSDSDPVGDRIPGSVARTASFAVALRDLGPWSGSLQFRHLGARPLTEDGSVQSKASTLTNMRVGYRFNKSIELALDVFNVFNRKADDIAYYYGSKLASESTTVNDVHFHPSLPRSVRASVRIAL